MEQNQLKTLKIQRNWLEKGVFRDSKNCPKLKLPKEVSRESLQAFWFRETNLTVSK